ncbi:hypothetical protein BDZ89DRAFT_413141 [Hymenopellis radicata]|nr:hypothetical protein BDZ89DRAFT_413141 [Hymenopellis radicata]
MRAGGLESRSIFTGKNSVPLDSSLSFVPPPLHGTSRFCMSASIDSDVIVKILHSIQSTRYVVFATATIMIYDHILSLHREIELIWQKRSSFMKIVFLWHRYFGAFCILFELIVIMNQTVSDSVRAFWFRWETLSFAISILTSELVLLSWIYIIYDRNFKIAISLGLLYVLEVAAVMTILGVSLGNLEVTNHFIATLNNFCSMRVVPPLFKYYWLPVLIYNAVVMFLFLFKSYQVLFSSIVGPNDILLRDVYNNST